MSSIGLARYDQDGNLVGSIKWVVDNSGTFYSYPQLVSMGNGRFLLGYGEMVTLAEQQAAIAANMNIDDSFPDPRRVPMSGRWIRAEHRWPRPDAYERWLGRAGPAGAARPGTRGLELTRPRPARTARAPPVSTSLQLSVYVKADLGARSGLHPPIPEEPSQRKPGTKNARVAYRESNIPHARLQGVHVLGLWFETYIKITFCRSPAPAMLKLHSQ